MGDGRDRMKALWGGQLPDWQTFRFAAQLGVKVEIAGNTASVLPPAPGQSPGTAWVLALWYVFAALIVLIAAVFVVSMLIGVLLTADPTEQKVIAGAIFMVLAVAAGLLWWALRSLLNATGSKSAARRMALADSGAYRDLLRHGMITFPPPGPAQLSQALRKAPWYAEAKAATGQGPGDDDQPEAPLPTDAEIEEGVELLRKDPTLSAVLHCLRGQSLGQIEPQLLQDICLYSHVFAHAYGWEDRRFIASLERALQTVD